MTSNLLILLIFISSIGSSACAGKHGNLSQENRALLGPGSAEIRETPDRADVAVRQEGVVQADSKCIYDIVADVDSWASWDRSILQSKVLSQGPIKEGSLFEQKFDGFNARAKVLVAERGQRLRWRGQDPKGSGPVGVHTWTFIAQGDGSTLVLNDEHFHTWFLRPVGWFTDLGISKQFATTIVDLKAEAERRCPFSS